MLLRPRGRGVKRARTDQRSDHGPDSNGDTLCIRRLPENGEGLLAETLTRMNGYRGRKMIGARGAGSCTLFVLFVDAASAGSALSYLRTVDVPDDQRGGSSLRLDVDVARRSLVLE